MSASQSIEIDTTITIGVLKRRQKILAREDFTMSTISFLIRDHSDEYSGFSLGIPDVDETSWVATVASIVAIRTAVEALTLGNVAKQTLTAFSTVIDDTRPADAAAQRELGLRLFYQDDGNGKKFHITIPCPDVSLIAEPGSNEVDLSGVSVVNTLVTAIEALARSPYGNTITFYKGLIVGRNN